MNQNRETKSKVSIVTSPPSQSPINKLSRESSFNKFLSSHKDEVQRWRTQVTKYNSPFVDQFENLVKLELPRMLLEISELNDQLDRHQMHRHESRLLEKLHKDLDSNFQLPIGDSQIEQLDSLYSMNPKTKLNPHGLYLPNRIISENAPVLALSQQIRPKLVELLNLFWKLEHGVKLLIPTIDHSGNSGVRLQNSTIGVLSYMRSYTKKWLVDDGWSDYSRKRIALLQRICAYPQSLDARLGLQELERFKLHCFKQNLTVLFKNLLTVQHILQLNIEGILKPRIDHTKTSAKIIN